MQKNVILLSNAYWPSIGGIENSLRHLAIEAKSAGDNVEIIVSDIGVPSEEPERFSTTIDGVNVTRYPISPFSNYFLKPFNIFASSWLLYKMLKKVFMQQPDTIIIARFHFGALAATLAGFKKIRYLVPSIIANQSSGERTEGESSFKKVKRHLFIRLHSVVQKLSLIRCNNFVFSETMRKQCMQLAKNKPQDYFLTKPGVDQSRFSAATPAERAELRNKLNLPGDKKLILFVGRFVKAKGVDVLIDAISEIDDSCHLILVGGGDEKPHFIARIKALGLSDRVSFVEPLRTVEDYYRCADVFVMSSRYEPLGQTILEAFSAGLSVVAFRRCADVNTATEELSMDKFVVYANEFTSNALALAINKSLSHLNEDNRLGASKEASEKFCWGRLYADLQG